MCGGEGVSVGGESVHHDGQRMKEMARDQSNQSMATGKSTMPMCLHTMYLARVQRATKTFCECSISVCGLKVDYRAISKDRQEKNH